MKRIAAVTAAACALALTGTLTVTLAGAGLAATASSAAGLGSWNKRYGAVYALTFTGLRQAGIYRVQVGTARSAAFRIAPAASLYAGLVRNWGAAEIALADERLGVPRAQLARDLAVVARWARGYLAQGHLAGGDTLNLYDNGAVAEAELLRALRCAAASGVDSAAVIAPRLPLGDLAVQLRLGESAAAGDPFGLGTPLGASDATPHAFGLWVTGALYREYGGSAAYAAFAQHQLDYALGANPWGASFVVGAGSSFPFCMQSEIAISLFAFALGYHGG